MDQILQILQDPQDKGERARQHVLQHHRPEQELDAYRTLYAQLSGPTARASQPKSSRTP